MKITKNGLYIINNNEKNITIEDNLNVIIFDELNILEKVELGENSIVDIFGYIENTSVYNFSVVINGKNSKLKLGYLLIAGDGEKIQAKILSKINANNSNAKLKIISIVGNNGHIDIDGILDISEGIKEIKGDLIEENIFIGDSGKINSIPNLFVGSNDVRASHSCKTERISDERLFYLRSRGIKKEKSISMMLESYPNLLYKCLTMVDNDYYMSLINKINSKIKTIN